MQSLPPYQLVRSHKRRTIGIQIKSAKVRVLAPFGVCEQQIQQLLLQKLNWLNSKISQQQNHVESSRGFVDGDILYFLGLPYVLKIQQCIANQIKEPVKICDEHLIVCVDSNALDNKSELVKEALHCWYQLQAQQLLSEKVEYWQNITGLKGSSLTIRQYKSRWGSCDNKRRLKFNWLLVMSPLWVVDYVIIHELCHLVHLNHSSAFWQLVQRYFDDPKIAKQWLKQHQSYLYW